MKPVRLRHEAGQDLHEIFDYFESVAPQALPSIKGDIWRAIDLLRQFPAIGMKVENRPY